MKSVSKCLRGGKVTVEFAIICPVFFMFVSAGIEFSRANMIRNSIQNAAYEGARCGILPGATNAECVAVALTELQIIGINSSTVTCTPADLTNADAVTVDVSVTMNGTNSYVMPKFLLSKILTASVTLPRE